MGTQLPLPKKGAEPAPQFSAHVYCGQTAAWIKMPLGTGIMLGPGDVMLDGVAAPGSTSLTGTHLLLAGNDTVPWRDIHSAECRLVDKFIRIVVNLV